MSGTASPPRGRPTPIRLPDDRITNEYELIRLLEPGVYNSGELKKFARELGLGKRNGGMTRAANGSLRTDHRIDGALQKVKQKGLAEGLGDGWWLLKGSKQEPQWTTFVIVGDPCEISLMLGAAADVARRIENPVNLFFCDPPWQLGPNMTGNAGARGKARRRDYSKVIDSYADVDPDRDYLEFSMEWMAAAKEALQLGGHIAVATDPERAADVQRAGKELGLRFQNSLVVSKPSFVPITTRKFAPSHMRITVLTSGPRSLADRTFNPLPEHGFSRNGDPYPQDVLSHVPPYDRRGLLRYSNQLSPQLVDEMLRTYTNRGDLAADLFCGSGTLPLVCLLRGRRALASDVNPDALRFTMGRILDVFQGQRQQIQLSDSFADSVAASMGQTLS